MSTPTLSLAQARRIAIQAQALDGAATDVLDTVRRIGSLQLDPTSRVAPSHLLVLWSRLGRYDPSELDRLLWHERRLFEWRAFLYPIDDLPLYRSRMARFPIGETPWHRRVRGWLAANASFRRYILRELERHGPLLSRDLEDRSRESWRSSGWTANRNVGQMLEFLMARGDVAVAGRRGAQRLWDLAERWYPPVDALPAREADALLEEKRLRTLGITRRGPGVSVTVRGLVGEWRVDPEGLARADDALPRRTTLLSPFDRLIYDRERTQELFGFRYRIEIYVPAAQREYGYFVLPILHREHLVGRIDPEYDRRARVLRVNAVFAEPSTRMPRVAVERAVGSLARFLGATEVVWP